MQEEEDVEKCSWKTATSVCQWMCSPSGRYYCELVLILIVLVVLWMGYLMHSRALLLFTMIGSIAITVWEPSRVLIVTFFVSLFLLWIMGWSSEDVTGNSHLSLSWKSHI